MKKWLLLVPLLLGLSLFCSGQAVTTLDQNCNVWGAAPTTPQCGGSSSAASGTQLFFPDIRGTITNQFEVLVQGTAPATLTVTVVGCMRGGTCSGALVSSSGTGSQILTPATASLNVYDKYGVTVSWTGGDATTRFVINRTGTVAKLSGTGTGVTIPGAGAGSTAYLVTASPYNAKCDGITDDSTAIQAAINAAQSAGSGTVVIPFGTCLGSGLTITASYVSIQGQYQRGSTIKNPNAGTDTLSLSGSIIFNQINNLAFTRSLAPTGSASGIKLTNVNTASLNYVESWDSVNNFNQVSGDANIHYYHCQGLSTLSATTNSWLIGNSSISTYIVDSNSTAVSGNAPTNALNIPSGSADFWLERFDVTQNGGLIVFAGTLGDFHLISLIDENNSATASISFTNANGSCNPNSTDSCDVSIVDAHLKNATGQSILITNSQGIHIVGSEFSCSASTNCIDITGSSSSGNSVVGSRFKCTGGTNTCNPLLITSSANRNTIVGNSFTALTANPFGTAITLSSSAVGNTIASNIINGFGSTGISIDSGSTGNFAYGNAIDTTNVTTAFSDSSTTGTFGLSHLGGFNGTKSIPMISGLTQTNSGLYFNTTVGNTFSVAGADVAYFAPTNYVVLPTGGIGVAASAAYSGGSFTAGTVSAQFSSPSAGVFSVDAAAVGDSKSKVLSAGIQSGGTTFTASGCGNTTLVGGASAGKYTSVTAGSCTVTITFGNSLTATTGWVCDAHDLTTVADANNITMGTSNTTTANLVEGTVAANDVIAFKCTGY